VTDGFGVWTGRVLMARLVVTSSVPVFSLACCILGARLRSSSVVRARSSCSRLAKRFAIFALSFRTLLSLSLSLSLSLVASSGFFAQKL
jgi:hypothetical protein